MRPRGDEIIPIRGRLPEDEAIVVAADDDKRRIARPQASDQAVAGSGPRGGNEEADRHWRFQADFMGRISRRAKMARMSGPWRPPSCWSEIGRTSCRERV